MASAYLNRPDIFKYVVRLSGACDRAKQQFFGRWGDGKMARIFANADLNNNLIFQFKIKLKFTISQPVNQPARENRCAKSERSLFLSLYLYAPWSPFCRRPISHGMPVPESRSNRAVSIINLCISK